jgi:hypothetical protein
MKQYILPDFRLFFFLLELILFKIPKVWLNLETPAYIPCPRISYYYIMPPYVIVHGTDLYHSTQLRSSISITGFCRIFATGIPPSSDNCATVVPGLLFWLLLPTNKEWCTVLPLHSPVANILQNPVQLVSAPLQQALNLDQFILELLFRHFDGVE